MHAFLFWLMHQHATNSLFNRSDLHWRIMFFCCSVGSSIFRFVNCEKPQVIFSFQFESEGTSDNLTFPAPRYHTLIIWNRMRCFLSGRRENKTDQLIILTYLSKIAGRSSFSSAMSWLMSIGLWYDGCLMILRSLNLCSFAFGGLLSTLLWAPILVTVKI